MIDKSAFIHPTAIVEDGAVIGAGAHIGPFCIVGRDVEIGEGTVLKSHVVINGRTKIGRDNEIYQFASIGEVNQDLKYAGEPTCVEIGDRNRIRESVTIHRGTVQGGGLTKVGSDNLLMINAHIAHDCTVGNRCILANNATLAGHVSVDDYAIIGGMTAVHQFCIIGAHVMVGGCSGVAQDVKSWLLNLATLSLCKRVLRGLALAVSRFRFSHALRSSANGSASLYSHVSFGSFSFLADAPPLGFGLSFPALMVRTTFSPRRTVSASAQMLR